MKLASIVILGIFMCTSLPIHAANEDRTTVSVGVGRNALKYTDRFGNTTNAEYPVLDLSISRNFGNTFVAFGSEIQFGTDASRDSAGTLIQTDSTIYSASAGYGFESGISLFGGWQYSEHNFGTPRHIEKGPFAGAGYRFGVGNTGDLNISLAYGNFDGSITAGPGESTGYSFSILWSDKYREGISYFLRARLTKYDFKLDDSVVTSGGREVKKDNLLLSVGLIF